MFKLPQRLLDASNQPYSVLATKDQSGSADNWNKYIEYTKNFAGMCGKSDINFHLIATQEHLISLFQQV